MTISCGKFSCSVTVGSSCFGAGLICISSVFTTTSSMKQRQIFIVYVDDQHQWHEQAKMQTLP